MAEAPVALTPEALARVALACAAPRVPEVSLCAETPVLSDMIFSLPREQP